MSLSKKSLEILLVVVNVLLFLCGAAVIGVGIWGVADTMYISDVIGNFGFSSSAILMVICGVCLILVSVLGCCGARTGKRQLVIVYTIVKMVIFIVLLAAAIVGAVFRNEIGDKMREEMTKGIKERYGLDNSADDDLTDGWDLMQTNLKCCAVDDQGWELYKQSRWFKAQFDQFDKEFVPPSCCVTERVNSYYLNQEKCQSFAYGPPRFKGGSHNDALHYVGCYTAVKDLIGKHADVILGVGCSFLVFLIAGIVVGIMYAALLKEGGEAIFRK